MERNTQPIAEHATEPPNEPPIVEPTSWNGVSYEDLMGSLEEQLSNRPTLPRAMGTVTAPMPAVPTVIVDDDRATLPRVEGRNEPTTPAPSPSPAKPARTRSIPRAIGRAILLVTTLGIAAALAAPLHGRGVVDRAAVSAWITRHVPKTTAPPPAFPAAQPIATTAPAPTTPAPEAITAEGAPTMIAPTPPPPMKRKKAKTVTKADDEATEIDDASSVLDRALEP